MKIAIAGAFGFIGQHLIRQILEQTSHDIVALSRSSRASDDPRMQCVTADLYSLKDATSSLQGCDVAVYLVHSMAPSSRLAQGSFRDFDFILADNFVRAARANGIQQIIYVGGMIPDCPDLSEHLRSRLEVENVLRSQETAVTALRCGIVIGSNGSSYSIIVRLTERLPVMILPKWMRTLSNPIYVDDLARMIIKCIEVQPEGHRVFDTGMKEAVTYKDIVLATARYLGKNPILINFPYVSPVLSKLWVRLISGAPKSLVYPLIDSVHHEMLIRPDYSLPADWGIETKNLSEAVRASFKEPFRFNTPRLLSSIRCLSEVRSVQRMHLPKDWNAERVADSYDRWLPLFLRPFIKIVPIKNGCEYRLQVFSTLLLTLHKDLKISHKNRQLFRVGEGVLVARGNRGRFEFRECYDKTYTIVALHNFKPSLPWNVYRWTQAVIHKIVMDLFGKHLKKYS